MRAYTATFTGIETGIEVISKPLGQPCEPGVYLGAPDREGRPFPYIGLDSDNPPHMLDGRLIDGALRRTELSQPGQMRWLLTEDNGAPSDNLLVRFNSFEHSDSLAKHFGVNRAMRVRGRGYVDLDDKENSSWVDSLDVIEPGAIVEIVSRIPLKKNLGKLVMNIHGQLVQVPKEEFRLANNTERDRMIQRVLVPDEQIRSMRPSKASDAFRSAWPKTQGEQSQPPGAQAR